MRMRQFCHSRESGNPFSVNGPALITWLAFFGAIAFVLEGCQRRAAADTSQTAQPTTSITLERGPCYGTCPVYKLRITSAGIVEYEGLRFVARMGKVTDTLPRDSVTALAAAFDSAGYSAMADRYVDGEPACGALHTDAPTIITSITIQGKTKRVEHYRGCSGAPPQLTALENRIDETVRVARWTKSGGSQ